MLFGVQHSSFTLLAQTNQSPPDGAGGPGGAYDRRRDRSNAAARAQPQMPGKPGHRSSSTHTGYDATGRWALADQPKL